MKKQKYVRLNRFDEIVIFPEILQHSEFKNLDLVSAGYCYIGSESVFCFGASYSLGLKSNEDDSEIVTRQLFKQ